MTRRFAAPHGRRASTAGCSARAEQWAPCDRRAASDQGKLLAVVTQNVDGLHQRAGTDPDKVIEVHGTAHWTRCWECGDRRPMAETLDRVRAGEDDPPCLVCGGILKSDTISFGQGARPRGDRPRLRRQQAVRSDARRRFDVERVSGGELRAGRARRGRHGRDRQRRRDRDGPPGRPPIARPDRRDPPNPRRAVRCLHAECHASRTVPGTRRKATSSDTVYRVCRHRTGSAATKGIPDPFGRFLGVWQRSVIC